jgi:TolA-binding protein
MNMNKLLFAVAVSLALSAPAVLAAEAQPGQKAAPTEDSAKQMRAMQENMIKMHEQMHKIMDAKDPAERERLMEEQRKTMQGQMKQMKEMHGGMGGMMGHDKMGGDAKPGATEKPAGK